MRLHRLLGLRLRSNSGLGVRVPDLRQVPVLVHGVRRRPAGVDDARELRVEVLLELEAVLGSFALEGIPLLLAVEVVTKRMCMREDGADAMTSPEIPKAIGLEMGLGPSSC